MRSQLKASKERELPQSVHIVFNGERLQDTDNFPTEAAEVDVTVIFEMLELTDAERKRYVSNLKQAGYGITVGTEFRSFSAVARADKEVVQEAVRGYPDCLKYAHEALKNDREFMAQIVKRDPTSFRYISDALKADRQIAAQAIDAIYSNLQWAADTVKDDKDLVQGAIRRSGMMLKFASETLRNDKETVMLAVSKDREALKFASEALKEDDEVLAAMKPERERTELEKALDQQKLVDSQFRQQTQQNNNYSGVEFRPTTLLDRMQIAIHNSSGEGTRFSAGLSGY